MTKIWEEDDRMTKIWEEKKIYKEDRTDQKDGGRIEKDGGRIFPEEDDRTGLEGCYKDLGGEKVSRWLEM